MSTTPKRYRLLKDLPDAKAGTILEFDKSNAYDYKSNRIGRENEQMSWYVKDYVENNPEWFELITETPTEEFKWNDELVKQFMIDRNNGKEYAPVHIDSYIEKFKQSKSTPPPKEYVCGVNMEWEIRSHPNDLSKVMKEEDCRFVGTNEECMQFIDKYMPPPKERIEVLDISFQQEDNKGYFYYIIKTSGYINHTQGIPKIKAAIEKAINQ